MRTNDTRVIPIRPDNRAAKVTKREDGSLQVEQRNGNTFAVADEAAQAFVIYTMLCGDEL